MFLLATLNAFGILWSSFLWGIAGVGAGILVAAPVYFIVWSLNRNDQEEAIRVTVFVVAGVVLIAILSGGYFEYEKQIQTQEENYRSSLTQPVIDVRR